MATTARSAGDPVRLGRWRVWQRLAAGSGTVVYEAADGRGAAAAVKTVAPGGNAKDIARRLHREAAMLRRAGVSGVVRLREDGSDAAVPYLAFELVRGPSLRELIARRGPLSPAQTAVLGALLADTVGRVHRRGVVHGDLKPANVLCPDDGPLLIDFDAATSFDVAAAAAPPPRLAGGGTARAARQAPAVPADADATVEMPPGGAAGVLRASPRWLAPEQVSGARVDGAADVFALGALLTFLCTGRSPFGDGPADAVLARVLAGEVDLDGVPAGLLALIGACLQARPADRPSAFELARELLPQRRWPAAA